jgi:carboxyl-terminal processing protease
MKKLFRHLPILAIGIICGSIIAMDGRVFAERQESDVTKVIPFEELRTFSEIFQKIKNDYVEEVDDKTLLEHAIQGMLSGLDPHSSYLTADDYQELQVGTTGEFGGLGIEVGMDDGFVKVIAPIDDTPAQRAGIKTGDVIVRLNDTPVQGMTLNDAVKIMRGKPGTPIVLTIVRENEDKPLKIKVVRDIIQVKSIKSRLLEADYGYVRVSHFQTHTGDDLTQALTDLVKENKRPIKGLVLDLRNNPGGVLNAAVAVADAFLKDGMIVYTEGRVNDAYLKFKARPTDLLEGAPMVVLVNGGSASASEIVAGALQDHKRAIIMGNKTFGKGSVQTILPINNNAALKLTTARYYTPSGRSIQAEGIKPDIELSKVQIASVDEANEDAVKESDLMRHLQREKDKSKKSSSEKTGNSSEGEKADEPLVKTDYAIYEALNLLKGLNIIDAARQS